MRPILLFATLLLGCNASVGESGSGVLLDPDAGTIVFDLTEMPNAVIFQPYEGRLQLSDGRPASFSVIGGALPAGLVMAESGQVTGEADWIGPGTAQVRGVDGAGVPFEGDVTIQVDGDGTVFIAPIPDQENNFSSTEQGMMDPWVRLAGTGIDQTEVTVAFGLFVPGTNGVPNRGHQDDVQVGEVPADDVTVSFGEFEIVENDVVDDSPPSYGGDGVFIAGSDTGTATLSMSHPDWGTGTGRLLVTPPDWCPMGVAWQICE